VPWKIYFRRRARRWPRKAPHRTQYLLHKEAARVLAKERLAFWNAHYGFRIGKVAIRNQRSRWGSCSKKGNLNFNYRIAFLPAHLSDYIIVHELCHLREFNHSMRFWDLVAKAVPDWKTCRAELRKIRI
jgi:predicted metal-dependent hydrolase